MVATNLLFSSEHVHICHRMRALAVLFVFLGQRTARPIRIRKPFPCLGLMPLVQRVTTTRFSHRVRDDERKCRSGFFSLFTPLKRAQIALGWPSLILDRNDEQHRLGSVWQLLLHCVGYPSYRSQSILHFSLEQCGASQKLLEKRNIRDRI